MNLGEKVVQTNEKTKIRVKWRNKNLGTYFDDSFEALRQYFLLTREETILCMRWRNNSLFKSQGFLLHSCFYTGKQNKTKSGKTSIWCVKALREGEKILSYTSVSSWRTTFLYQCEPLALQGGSQELILTLHFNVSSPASASDAALLSDHMPPPPHPQLSVSPVDHSCRQENLKQLFTRS